MKTIPFSARAGYAAWWFFIVCFALCVVAVGLALCVPLLDAAWTHFQGGHPTVLRWVVSGTFALGGLEIIKRGAEQLADFLHLEQDAREGPQ